MIRSDQEEPECTCRSRLSLRSDHREHGHEQTDGVDERETDGGEENDAELVEEDEVGEHHEGGRTERSPRPRHHRHAHLFQCMLGTLAAAILRRVGVRLRQVNYVVYGETDHQDHVHCLEHLKHNTNDRIETLVKLETDYGFESGRFVCNKQLCKISQQNNLPTIRAVCKCVFTNMSFSRRAAAIPLQTSRKLIY